MPYFQLRVTPGEFSCPFPESLGIVKSILKRPKTDSKCYITCDEHLNKFGEETKRHFHFNFFADEKKDTLQDATRKYYASLDYVCKSNKCYSLSVVDEPDDIKRWLRYCMKEKVIFKLTKLPYSDEEVKIMTALAKDERARSIEYQLKKRLKTMEKNSYYDKLCNKLDKMDLKTFRQINIELCKMYVTDGKPVCVRTIDGYTNNYLLKNSLISYEEFYNSSH